MNNPQISQYDAWLTTAPEREVPDDSLECAECGAIAHATTITDLHAELDACSDACAEKRAAHLKRESVTLRQERNSARRELTLTTMMLTAAGLGPATKTAPAMKEAA